MDYYFLSLPVVGRVEVAEVLERFVHGRNGRKEEMSGSISGGVKAGITNKKRYGEDFYSIIGAKGGKNGGSPKGQFGHGRVDPSAAGKIGGKISKRTRWIVLDESPFEEEFNQPNWWDKLKGRLR